jgi:hypothetical protein
MKEVFSAMMKYIMLILAVLGVCCLGCNPRSEPRPCYQTKSRLPAEGQAAVTVQVPAGADPLRDLVLSEEAKHYLLQFGRALCDGREQEASRLLEPAEVATLKVPLILYLFHADGGSRAHVRIDDPTLTLREKIKRAAAQICNKAQNDYLHLLVVSYSAALPNFGIKGFFDYRVYEPQVTGLAYTWKDQRAEIDPLEALEHNLNSKSSRTELARRLKLDPKTVPSLNELAVEVYRVIHFGEAYPDRQFTNYFRGHQVFTAEELTREGLEERLRWIGKWYEANVENGEVHYEYAVSQGRYHDEKRTMVRSTMAVWILNRLAEYLNNERLKTLGEQTIDYYLQAYFRLKESLAAGKIQPSAQRLPSGDEVKYRFTAASFIAAAILERQDYSKRRMAVDLLLTFAMSFKRPDGVIWTPHGQLQFFEPGQLLLAVAYAAGKTQQQGYSSFFTEVFSVYQRALEALLHLGNGLFVPYAPAWFTQPAAERFRQTHEPLLANFIFRINDRVARFYELNAHDQVYYDVDGILAPKRDSWGNTSVAAACLESITDAATTAKLVGDQARLQAYKKVIRRTVAYLLRLQYLPVNTYYLQHRERVLGGFKRDLLDTTSWMDNVWHLTSAFIKIQRNDLLAP